LEVKTVVLQIIPVMKEKETVMDQARRVLMTEIVDVKET